MTYTLKFSKTFQKDFAKLDSTTQSRILVILERMQWKPLEHSKKLKNMQVGIFRRRIGDYRLRFDIIQKEAKVYLYRIRHRKDVYRD